MNNEVAKVQVQKVPGVDHIGGERYLRDVERSRMNGADPRRAERMAFRAWGWRSFGNLASKGEALRS